jgi:hypothetical protein
MMLILMSNHPTLAATLCKWPSRLVIPRTIYFLRTHTFPLSVSTQPLTHGFVYVMTVTAVLATNETQLANSDKTVLLLNGISK